MLKQKRFSAAYYGILIIAGVLYALMALSDNIWADEAYTLAMLPHSFGEIWRITAADVHPPLYYFAAKLFSAAFGYSQYAVRLLSGICFFLTIAIGGAELTRLFSKKTGLLFMGLYLLFPFSLEHAIEARMYGLASLSVFLCALFAYRVWLTGKTRDWVGLVASGLCAGYSHYFALVAAGVIYGLLFLCCLFRRRKLLKGFFLSALLTIALYLPWLKCLLEQLAYKANNEYWIGAITIKSLMGDLITLLHANGFSAFPLFFGLLGLLFLLCAVRDKAAAPLLALSVPVITMVLGVGVSILMRPIYIVRYLVPCAPLMIFFVAWGISAIRRDSLRSASIALFFAAFSANLIFAVEDILPNPDKFGADAAAQAKEAQAYVIQTEQHFHVSQVVSYYEPQLPIYTPETLGAASPYKNIHPLEEYPEEGIQRLAVVTDVDTPPDDSLFPGYCGTKLGTYYAAYDSFDLWLMEK